MSTEALLPNAAFIWAAIVLPMLAALWVVSRPGGTNTCLFLAPLAALIVAAVVPLDVEIAASWLLLGARLGVDELTAPMLVLTALVWSGAGLALPAYAGVEMTRRIAPAWLLALAGNVGLVLALDQVTFFVCFTLMSFAAYALVVARGDALALTAGRRYMIFVIVGEVVLFNALVLEGSNHDAVCALLLIVGFGIKAALLGLHTWLPLAHTAAPAPASAVLSGSMVAAGTLGWLRFVDPDALPLAASALAVSGIAGALYATVLGLIQTHPKAVLAYSSVAQLGLIAIAVAAHLNGYTGAAALAVLYLLHHGLAKAALFVSVALMERLQGSARRLGIAGLLLMAATIVGLPFTSGASLKVALKAAALDGLPVDLSEGVQMLLTLAAVGSTLLMARFVFLLPKPHQGQSAAAGSLVAGFGLLVVSSIALGVHLPDPEYRMHAMSLVAPFVIGVALAFVGWAVSVLGVVPGLRGSANGEGQHSAAPRSLLQLSVRPAVRFTSLKTHGLANFKKLAERQREFAGLWVEHAERALQRWALACIATGLIALYLVAEFSLR